MKGFARSAPVMVEPDSASAVTLRPFGRGTLSRTLVRRVALLVAITAILLDASAVAVARRVWLAGLDSELQVALRSPIIMKPSGQQQGPWASELEVSISGGQVRVAVAFARDQAISLTQDQINALMDVRLDGRPRTLSVPELGPYRVAAQVMIDGQRVVGVSMRSLASSYTRLLMIEAALTIAAVIAAALIVAAVVRVTLRPLTQLARTATRVGSMRLDQGEVSLGRLGGSAIDPESEVGQVGLALNRMLDNVEDALVARHRSEAKVRAFVADASHELRNPLASIRGYAELMRRDADMPEQTALAVDRINVESKRMSTLVDQMLLLARLDQGTPMGSHRIDMTQMVVDAVTDASVAGPDHHWKLDVPDDPIEINGDPNQVQEVVANLLGNARKHTPAGTHVLVTLSLASGPVTQDKTHHARGVPTEESHVVLTVADDGPGIAPDLLDHVFERFVRADQARTHDDEGSTGLGLAIVAAVVDAHGGRVSVESVAGATKFTVLLPVGSAAPETTPY